MKETPVPSVVSSQWSETVPASNVSPAETPRDVAEEEVEKVEVKFENIQIRQGIG